MNTWKSASGTSDTGVPPDKELRKKAEKLLNSRMASLETMSDIDVRNLVHELLLGQERNYLTGKPFHLFIHKEDRDIFYFHRRKAPEKSLD